MFMIGNLYVLRDASDDRQQHTEKSFTKIEDDADSYI